MMAGAFSGRMREVQLPSVIVTGHLTHTSKWSRSHSAKQIVERVCGKGAARAGLCCVQFAWGEGAIDAIKRDAMWCRE